MKIYQLFLDWIYFIINNNTLINNVENSSKIPTPISLHPNKTDIAIQNLVSITIRFKRRYKIKILWTGPEISPRSQPILCIEIQSSKLGIPDTERPIESKQMTNISVNNWMNSYQRGQYLILVRWIIQRQGSRTAMLILAIISKIR